MARRKLQLTSPLLSGPDVRDLQKALNRFYRGHLRIAAKVGVDGQYGPQTDHETRRVAYLLGVGRHHNHGRIGTYAQRIIEDPRLRGPILRIRSRKRIKEARKHAHTGDAVLAWERSKVGITESPANSNRGAEISKWQRDVAGIDGQPWCGAFQGYALKHIAGIVISGGVVYTPNIISYAKSGTGGFASWHSWKDRKPGDLILFKWPGVSSAPCDHVGMLDHDREHTIEGNTSSGDSGSQNNGGGVYRRNRGPEFVVGCARPRYHH
jgi:hypothetical protein